MSRIREPYVRFCERDETELIVQSHPTRYFSYWFSISQPRSANFAKRPCSPAK